MPSGRRMRRECMLLIGAAALALHWRMSGADSDRVEGSGALPVPHGHTDCDGGALPCASVEPPLTDSAEEDDGAGEQRKKVYVIEQRRVYDWSGNSVFGGFRS